MTNYNEIAIAMTNSDIRNALEDAIDIITLIDSKIFENSLSMNYTLEERSAFGMFYTKSTIKALLDGNYRHADFLSDKMEVELQKIDEFYDMDADRYLCVQRYFDKLNTLFESLTSITAAIGMNTEE